ncbi:MAG: hypothetical protein IPM68_15290 [Flavobacteriales bacterium]|nr:hypothetical protein [Flavobacteriales bacterium]
MDPLRLLLMVLPTVATAQWTWTAVAPLPLPTANHAVCAAAVNGSWQVYVFGGITTGLSEADIHRHAFRYDVDADAWSALPDIPDTLGKIAAAASVVGDTAYVIGGYHVFPGAPYERSSDRVHRLDLSTGTWMADGAPVPVPIDDHVQAVWRDSLIYVVTGWSNSANVAQVQVYDPAHDAWAAATPVPNTNLFKAFGASGVIIGDTLIYHGGAAMGGSFPAQDRVRIGLIDPLDPLTITWQPAVTGGQGPRYRSGAVVTGARANWIGGSAVSYNYDAVAYNGSGVVAPVLPVLQWDGTVHTMVGTAPTAVMDLRGVGDIGGGRFVVAGGIGAQQVVLDSVWLVLTGEVGMHEVSEEDLFAAPNPTSGECVIGLPQAVTSARYTVRDAWGRQVMTGAVTGVELRLDLSDLVAGVYFLHLPLVQGAAGWRTALVRE